MLAYLQEPNEARGCLEPLGNLGRNLWSHILLHATVSKPFVYIITAYGLRMGAHSGGGYASTVFCASSCVSLATEARCSCCLASIRCCFSSSLASSLAFLCQTSDSATTRTPNRLLCLSLLLVSVLNLHSLLPEKSDGASAPFPCILLIGSCSLHRHQ